MLMVIVMAPLVLVADFPPFFEEDISLSPDKYRLWGAECRGKLQHLFVLCGKPGPGRNPAQVYLTRAADNRVMDRRLVTAAFIIVILI
jgi:hypothetical protein